MEQELPEAALISDISGYPSLKVRRLLSFLVFVVVCGRVGETAVFIAAILGKWGMALFSKDIRSVLALSLVYR